MYKRILGLILLLILILPIPVQAARTGSIRVIQKNGEAPIPGGSVTLYPITQWGCDPEADAQNLAEFARENRLPGICKEIDASGCVIFSGLTLGQYLLVQTQPARGYEPFNPFLVALPMTVGGETVTDLMVMPKTQPSPEDTLPQTGQLRWPIFCLAGAGVLLWVCGWWIRKKE